jgi:hypothetical protein
VALIDSAWFSVNVHVVAPLRHGAGEPGPLPVLNQFTNLDETDGLAVSVIVVPSGKLYEHVEPQSIPAGLEMTVPDPAPAFVTVNVTSVAVACGVDRAAALAGTRDSDKAVSTRTSLIDGRDRPTS